MPYNIEEEEKSLKKKTPYPLKEEQWDAMQARIKANVLATVGKEKRIKRLQLNYFRISAVAASVILLLGVFFFMKEQQHKDTTRNTFALEGKYTPEQKLDQVISDLNENELKWQHHLNENDISEQNEYFEN